MTTTVEGTVSVPVAPSMRSLRSTVNGPASQTVSRTREVMAASSPLQLRAATNRRAAAGTPDVVVACGPRRGARYRRPGLSPGEWTEQEEPPGEVRPVGGYRPRGLAG